MRPLLPNSEARFINKLHQVLKFKKNNSDNNNPDFENKN